MIEVNSTSGDIDASSCTLVDAFLATYYQQAHGTCPAGDGDDVIILPPDVTINVDHDYTGPVAALPMVSSTLLLVGNGSTLTTSLGGPLINVGSSGVLSVNGVTFENIDTFDSNSGAAISVQGSLNVTNSIFAENSSQVSGGAIHAAFANVVVEDSVFVDNSSGSDGAAIYSDQGTLNVRSSYFAGNTGTAISSNSLNVVNSTFRENSGAIDVRPFGSGSVSYSTFEANGAAVSLEGNAFALANNVFSHAVGGYPGSNCNDFNDGEGAGMYTVERNLSDDFSCPGATVVADRNAFAFGDPLAFRGANTVLPLRPGSAAIVTTSCVDASGQDVVVDQRGVSRNSQCSLGAFQFDEGDYVFTSPRSLHASNLLISSGNSIFEMTRTGQRLRTFFPSPHVGVYGLRGVQPIGLDTIGMFLQQEDAHLQVYGVVSDSWSDFAHAGWSTLNSVNNCEISHVGNRWLLSGYSGSSVGENYIVAFDPSGFQGSASTCPNIRALQPSPKVLLYVICDTEIDVFDPQTLVRTKTIDTSKVSSGNTVTTGAVATSGDIFLSETDGYVYRIDDAGNQLASTHCFNDDIGCGEGNSTMAVSDDGKLFLGSWTSPSTITMLDTDFTTVTSIPTGLSFSNDTIWITSLVGDKIFASKFE